MNPDAGYRRKTPAPTRAVQAQTKRLRAERQGAHRRVDGTVPPDAIAFSARAGAVLFLFAAALLTVCAKAAWLAFGPDARLDERLAMQRERTITIAPQRGSIVDRWGRPLAVSIELGSVYADPKVLAERDDPADAASLLSPLLAVPEADLAALLTRPGRFVWLARQVPEHIASAVRELAIPGVRVVDEAHRHYPNGPLAAQVIGFTGIEGQGLEGLEHELDSALMGERFQYRVLRDGRRRTTNSDGVLARRSTEGKTVVLTLDHAVQHRAERSLQDAIGKHEAKGGFVVAMDAETGALLALASSPRFDPNAFAASDKDAWRLRPMKDVFEPGSTMKAVVVAGALDAGVVEPSTSFFLEHGNYRIGRNVVHDTHPADRLDVADIVKVSSNVGAAKIAELLGPGGLEAVYRRFGIGKVTGIDLPGEERGILHPSAGWSRIGLATHAFGQGMAVTGLQLARAYAALVNGGHLVTPHVVAELRDPAGGVTAKAPAPDAEPVITEATSRTMRHLLARVLEEGGTGTRAAMAEYSAGGKTGTAQKVKDGRYAPGLYVSSFIGFAPVERPRVVVYAVLDEPTDGYYGGTVAGPIFKEVTPVALRALGVPPDRMQTGVESIDTELGSDEPPPLISRGEAWEMPELLGLSARDVVALLAPHGLDIVIDGTGLVAAQQPPAGATIPRGATLALMLRPDAPPRRPAPEPVEPPL